MILGLVFNLLWSCIRARPSSQIQSNTEIWAFPVSTERCKLNLTNQLSFLWWRQQGHPRDFAHGLIQTKSTTDVHGTAIASVTQIVWLNESMNYQILHCTEAQPMLLCRNFGAGPNSSLQKAPLCFQWRTFRRALFSPGGLNCPIPLDRSEPAPTSSPVVCPQETLFHCTYSSPIANYSG